MILKLAWAVNFIMGTSPTESMNATANIFLGIVSIQKLKFYFFSIFFFFKTEAPLLIK